MSTKDYKKTIDELSYEVLQEEVLKGRSSRFQGDRADYAKARLAQLKDQKQDAKHEKEIELKEKRITIAEEANRLSKIALIVAALALLISLWAFLNDYRESSDSNKALKQGASHGTAEKRAAP